MKPVPFERYWQVKTFLQGFLLRRWQEGVVCLIAVLSAGTLTTMLLKNSTFASSFNRLYWPTGGLVIYTAEPFADFIIEKSGSQANHEQEHIVGLIGSSGSISLPKLTAGNYVVQIEHSGKESYVQAITVEENRLTIVGFPEKIALPKEEI